MVFSYILKINRFLISDPSDTEETISDSSSDGEDEEDKEHTDSDSSNSLANDGHQVSINTLSRKARQELEACGGSTSTPSSTKKGNGSYFRNLLF